MHLLLLAALISLAASRLLPRARWVYQAPGLGLAAWFAVLASIVISGAGASLSLLAHWPATQQTVCTWWAWCLDILSGRLGPAGRIVGWLAVTAFAVLATRAARTIVRTVREASRLRQGHLEALSILGRPDPRLGAVVVDDDRPAAYALPGQGGRIVITSGALATLPHSQAGAILAHERAHTTGHHHLLLATARLLTHAFPGVAVLTDAHRQIDRLVELHADDIATRRHAPLDLARALVTCAEAATQPGGVPVPAMAAAAHGGDALERIHRLLQPPAPLSRRRRLAVAVTLAALVGTPILVAALGVAFPALGACLPAPTVQ